jgi:hypothetical protein
MKFEEIIKAIERINDKLWEQTNDECIYLEYSTNYYYDFVKFLDMVIWSSDNDMRKYIDEENDIQEDLEVYLRREVNKIVDSLRKVRL